LNGEPPRRGRAALRETGNRSAHLVNHRIISPAHRAERKPHPREGETRERANFRSNLFRVAQLRAREFGAADKARRGGFYVGAAPFRKSPPPSPPPPPPPPPPPSNRRVLIFQAVSRPISHLHRAIMALINESLHSLCK